MHLNSYMIKQFFFSMNNQKIEIEMLFAINNEMNKKQITLFFNKF